MSGHIRLAALLLQAILFLPVHASIPASTKEPCYENPDAWSDGSPVSCTLLHPFLDEWWFDMSSFPRIYNNPVNRSSIGLAIVGHQWNSSTLAYPNPPPVPEVGFEVRQSVNEGEQLGLILVEIRELHLNGADPSAGVSPDGCFVAVGQNDGVDVYNSTNGTQYPRVHPVPGVRCFQAVFDKDGLLALSCSGDVYLYTSVLGLLTAPTEPAAAIRPQNGRISFLRFSRDGAYLAIGFDDTKGVIMIWDMTSKRELRRTLVGQIIWDMLWMPDNRILVSFNKYQDAQLLSLRTVSVQAVPGVCRIMALSPDGTYLAFADTNSLTEIPTRLRLVAYPSMRDVVTRIKFSWIRSLAFAESMDRLYVATENYVAMVSLPLLMQASPSPDTPQPAPTPTPAPTSVPPTPRGAHCTAMSVAGARCVASVHHAAAVRAVSLQYGGLHVAAALASGALCLSGVAGGWTRWCQSGAGAGTVSFSSDGVWLAVGVVGGAVSVLEALTGAEHHRVPPGSLGVNTATAAAPRAAASSGWGGSVAAATPGGAVRLFDAAGMALRSAYAPPHPAAVEAVAFPASGEAVAVLRDARHSAWVWDAASGATLLASLPAGIAAAAVSADGTCVAVLSAQTLRVWRRHPTQGGAWKPLRGGAAAVPWSSGVALSADGTLAVGWGGAGVVVWDTDGRRQVSVLPVPGVVCAALSDDQLVATGGSDGRVTVWQVDPLLETASTGLDTADMVGITAACTAVLCGCCVCIAILFARADGAGIFGHNRVPG